MQTHAIPAGKLILKASEYAHDREKWLKARRSGLGASEVAAILGLSPWSTPYKVWKDKVSSEPPVELETEPIHPTVDVGTSQGEPMKKNKNPFYWLTIAILAIFLILTAVLVVSLLAAAIVTVWGWIA